MKAYAIQCVFLSDSISIERGCRQGDQISSYLFVLCAQLMYSMVLNNKSITGISVGNIKYKITQFADDTTLILDGNKTFLAATLNLLQLFGSLSGLVMNLDKTKLIWMGKKRQSKDKLDIKNTLFGGETEFTLLGLKFPVDLENIVNLNYHIALSKIENLFNARKNTI